MSVSNWDEISGFQSFSEYERFVEWINGQVESGVVEEIPAKRQFEKWFRHNKSGEIWRLDPPDYSYMGVFKRVKLPEPPANSKKSAP